MGKVVSHIEVSEDGEVTIEVEHAGTIVAKMMTCANGAVFYDEAACRADDPCEDIVSCDHVWEWEPISAERFAYWVS